MIRTSIIVISGLLLAEAIPTCDFSEGDSFDLVCAPDSDFVLERGLVSDNPNVTSIKLRACRITDVGYESFEQLPSLKHLDLSQNELISFKLGVLDGLRQLKLLNLSYNQLTYIQLGIFDETPFLKVLDLSSNKINNLQLGVLDGFQQLKVLNLSHNQLTSFPLGLFDQKPNLEFLNLKGNSINDLELGILDLMKKLKHVDISNNKIVGKNMSSYIFDKTPTIQYIDFSMNDMTGSESIMLHAFTALKTLNLDKCSLTEVPEFATKPNLRTMKRLMLNGNKILTLDDPKTFENLEELNVLELAGNSISHVVDSVFTPLSNLKTIILSHNRLKQIPVSLFQNLQKLTNVDLSNNALEFVPVNAFRGAPIKNLYLHNNWFTYLPEYFCLDLKQSGGKMSKFYFNRNPWQCACLRDIIDEAKTNGIIYDSEGYDGHIPACVTSTDFSCKRNQETNAYFIELYKNLIS